MAVSLQGDDPVVVLDRLQIPDDVRLKIAERLTPGSSFIVGDIAINSATLAKGADFLVWAKDMPAKIQPASLDSDLSQPRPRKKYRSTRRKPRTFTFTRPPVFERGGYPRWPW
jgi:hypothetical protein